MPFRSEYYLCGETLGITLLTHFCRAKNEITSAGGSIGHEYTLFKGFVATLPEVSAANLKNHPDVDGIEKDSVVTTQ